FAEVEFERGVLAGLLVVGRGFRHLAEIQIEPLVALGRRQEIEVDAILRASEEAGERAWQLPLYDDYRRKIDSEIADIRNIGDRYGGAITAGLFLKEFAGDTPWLHLDIAGPARSTADEFETPKGATGVGVRTLVRYIESQ
ncbi:MAG: leucyl aminopeptidase family protein, partial [Chloroflexi bacterium]|nr:leucyl aminopeptidase family protein [Chloroflexota bacterium]